MPNLIKVDGGYTDIIRHDGFSSAVLDSFSSPSASPADVAWVSPDLISSDTNTDLIYKHLGFS